VDLLGDPWVEFLARLQAKRNPTFLQTTIRWSFRVPFGVAGDFSFGKLGLQGSLLWGHLRVGARAVLIRFESVGRRDPEFEAGKIAAQMILI
jgi:hypothetical protein